MKIYKIILAVFFIFSIFGCNYVVTDIQDIEINYYLENEKNIKLAENLIYYDPQYIASKIPAFDENTSKGIRFGYFIRSSDKKPRYRITYNLKKPSIVANLAELKEGFENFIPALAAFHVSKESIFVELKPIGKSWAKSLFSESAGTLLSESSTLLKKLVSSNRFLEISAQLQKEYGKPLKISFVRAQYYEAFGKIPESVSLFYLAKFDNKKSKMVRISIHQQGQKWLVMGFKI